LAHRQEYATLLVLPRGGGRPNVDALQQAVRSAGREYVSRVRTLVERYDAQLIQERLLASISTGFSILGLLLASIGLYGVLAFTVARRTSEIGVRMALGASRGRILRLVLTSAAWVVAIGVAIGGPIAWSAARVGASIGVALTTPPIPVAAATTIVAVVAFIASWVPAWRASRIDPTRAIHSE
jgi:ABC-type antimicrobial peptide transport system permease subunit